VAPEFRAVDTGKGPIYISVRLIESVKIADLSTRIHGIVKSVGGIDHTAVWNRCGVDIQEGVVGSQPGTPEILPVIHIQGCQIIQVGSAENFAPADADSIRTIIRDVAFADPIDIAGLEINRVNVIGQVLEENIIPQNQRVGSGPAPVRGPLNRHGPG